MIKENYINTLKKIKKYSEISTDDLNVISSKIQLNNSQKDGFEYIDQSSNKYYYLQLLIHSALENEEGFSEDEVFNFITKDLKLLWGGFVFIDPKSVNTGQEETFYLLGPVNGEIKPSFSFPFLYNSLNFRGQREFKFADDKWVLFYTRFNEKCRSSLSIKDDFTKFFENESNRRNKSIEKKNNLLYISSGEIDHCILQWLIREIDVSGFNQEFKIKALNYNNPNHSDARDFLHKTYSNELEKESGVQNIVSISNTFKEENEKLFLQYKHLNKKGEIQYRTSGSFKTWLNKFGLLNSSGFPTERLIAAIEFFYYHLKELENSKSEFGKTLTYFTHEDVKWYESHTITKKFTDSCENCFPVVSNLNSLIDNYNNDYSKYKNDFDKILETYFNCLVFFDNKNEHNLQSFARFNILSHFYQRCVHSIYNSFNKEESCRAILVFPVFSNNKNDSDSNDKNSLSYLGYFLSTIKDSDSKGRCFFNWRTHSGGKPKSDSTAKFYDDYLFIFQSFFYQLAQNEIQQVYYRGIEENHKDAVKKNVTKSSLASIIARSMAHTDASHSMIYLQELLLEKIETSNTNKAASLFKAFNYHLRQLMELTADITGGIGNQTSYQYNIEEVIDELEVQYFPKNIPSFLNESIVDNQFRCVIESNVEDHIVLFPGGENCKTALLQILKNIYRNIFKHNNSTVRGNVILNIKTKEPEDADLRNKYLELIITEQVPTTPEKFERLKKIVDESLLNEFYKVDGKAWGIKEMHIQAAYLIGLAIEEIHNTNYSLHNYFSEKQWYRVTYNNNFLEHRLYLKKEKRALVIVKNQQDEKNNTPDNSKNGFYFKYVKENILDTWESVIDKDFEYVVFEESYLPKKFTNKTSKAFKYNNFKIFIVSTIKDALSKSSTLEVEWLKIIEDRNCSPRLLIVDSHFDTLTSNNKVDLSRWESYDYIEGVTKPIEYGSDFIKSKVCSCNIAVLDERIQNLVCKSEDSNITELVSKGVSKTIYERDLLDKKGIYIPSLEDFNIQEVFYNKINKQKNSLKNTDDKFENLLEELRYCFKTRNSDYVIIHFSGLEAISNGLSQEKYEYLVFPLDANDISHYEKSRVENIYNYIIGNYLNLAGSGKYLVLTSGKGIPTTLPNKSYFINLNSLEYLFRTKGKNKLDFIKTLESVRQITNEI